jgi:hypothetical protein
MVLQMKRHRLRHGYCVVLCALLAGLALLHTLGRADGSVKAAKSVRLRGIQKSSAYLPVVLPLTEISTENRLQLQLDSARNPKERRRQDVRGLETMFENTETKKHVSVKQQTELVDPQELPDKKAGDVTVTEVEEAEELALMMVDQPKAVGPVKEEPKELYVHNGAAGKSKTPKSSKDKGAPKSATEAPETVVGEVAEEGETAAEASDEEDKEVKEGSGYKEVSKGGGGGGGGAEEDIPEVSPGPVSGEKGLEASPPGM